LLRQLYIVGSLKSVCKWRLFVPATLYYRD
jgi:hypothetical protein